MEEAVSGGDHAEVNWLIDEGADINMLVVNMDGTRTTLLQVAIFSEDLDMVELLIRRGINVDGDPRTDTSPLDTAAVFSWVAGAALLIGHGAEVDAKTVGGMSPIYLALLGPSAGYMEQYPIAPAEQLNMVLLLIHAGADVFERKDDGETLLMSAASRGNAGVVLALIAAGVDPEACDEDGDTAIDYARWWEHTHIQEILLEETHRRLACIAFAMGSLSRLGSGSMIFPFDSDVVALIMRSI